jgi:sugar fermentation stimulation protein A
VANSVFINFGPLHEAVFVERPNRFVVYCKLQKSGELVSAHLADPGRLIELLVPGARLWLRYADRPHRKTKWSAILVETQEGGSLVSLQSTLVNRLTEKALQRGFLEEFQDWEYVRAEYPLNDSRWDFLLRNQKGEHLILEVKSVTLSQNGVAMFPDAVTDRGRRHVLELTKLHQSASFHTAVLFVIQRNDTKLFRPAYHIDPAFGEALQKASQEGVQLSARRCFVRLDRITLGSSIPIELD